MKNTGKCCVKMKTSDITVILLQTNECQRLPENCQKIGERHAADPHRPQKEQALLIPTAWTLASEL